MTLIKFLILLIIFTVTIPLIGIKPAFATSTITWTIKTPMPTARGSLGLVVAGNGKIYAIGGMIPGYFTDVVEEYNPLTNTWRSRTSMLTERGKLGVVLTNNEKIYAIGGYSRGTVTGKVEVYDPDLDTWITKTSMPTARGGLGVVAAPNGKIYAIGGHSDKIGILATVEEYDPLTDTWTTKTSMPTIRHLFGVAVVPSGKIYAIGGYDVNGIVLTSVEEYDPLTDTWTTKTSMPTARAGLGIAAAPNGKIYAIGGHSATYLSSVEEYDSSTNVWSELAPNFTVRSQFGLVSTQDGKLYAVGGSDVSGFLNRVEEGIIYSGLPPSIDAGGPYSVGEGNTVQVSATGSDPDNDPLTYGWDLDNNSTFETLGQTATFSAAFLDGPSNHTIVAKVSDGVYPPVTNQATINVINISPNVAPITSMMEPVLVNTQVNASVSFTDPGILDTHTAEWIWGDNSISAGNVDQQNDTVTGSHTYTTPGVYEINVTVTDDDGGSDQPDTPFRYLVVYDSSASGGFVTGAGSINSPEGAYIPTSSLTGIARFGFISKYQPGANTPFGHTQFRFQAAGFTFSSTDYQWLVVAGSQAKFKGAGTVGGSGNYGFLLSATDGAINGGGGLDKFRIKIWDKDNNGIVIYDNQLGASDNTDPTTAITGGNIIIH